MDHRIVAHEREEVCVRERGAEGVDLPRRGGTGGEMGEKPTMPELAAVDDGLVTEQGRRTFR